MVSLLEDWQAKVKSEITAIQSNEAKTEAPEIKLIKSSFD
jgi:hypothetical protein